MSNTEMKELKGLECDIATCNDLFHAYVVQADRELGITLHDIETDIPCFCLNKQELMDHMTTKAKNRVYHEAFTVVVEQILRGRIITYLSFDREGVHNRRRLGSRHFSCAYQGGK